MHEEMGRGHLRTDLNSIVNNTYLNMLIGNFTESLFIYNEEKQARHDYEAIIDRAEFDEKYWL